MIEETAIVVAVENDVAVLQTQRRSACQSCSVKQGCGTSVLSKVVGQRSTQISVTNTIKAAVGDEVLLAIEDNALVQGSLLMYALPLVMMLVFAVVGEYWAQANQFSHELITILFAVAGFVLAMIITRLTIHSSRLKHRIQPRMIRIMRRGGADRDTMLAL
ncbi:MAG TPA: SoxR reducing system RseC family protein [Gammaproteobacteria bacterium]